MPKFNGSHGLFIAYTLFVAVISMLVLREMLLSPSESESAIFLGLSIPRLAISSGLFLTFIFSTAITIQALRDQEWGEDGRGQRDGGPRLCRRLPG